ncbi:prolipoprotein diacylglyceryl transferase family protein [Massilia sp. W12]|uniref:prolipoprotein diacylglyceryl transferase n=1 Tax=Massilia sp. W12 TaxID=3126507 RepID=UPI0030D06CDC
MIAGPNFDAFHANLIHYLLEWAGILAGMQYYRYQKRQRGQGALLAPGNFAIVVGCIAGAALGNKLVFWIEYAHLIPQKIGDPRNWFMGQSIVGGLLGGLLGVEISKKLIGQRESTGDLFVFPLLLGIIIGRIGCFLAGLHDGTYGLPGNLPWAVDFGDGQPRHPTQLYEIGFLSLLWFVLQSQRARLASQNGLLFKLFLTAYLCWRVAVDGIKPIPYVYPFGLSGIQWVCLLALALYLPGLLKQWQAWRHPRILQGR